RPSLVVPRTGWPWRAAWATCRVSTAPTRRRSSRGARSPTCSSRAKWATATGGPLPTAYCPRPAAGGTGRRLTYARSSAEKRKGRALVTDLQGAGPRVEEVTCQLATRPRAPYRSSRGFANARTDVDTARFERFRDLHHHGGLPAAHSRRARCLPRT